MISFLTNWPLVLPLTLYPLTGMAIAMIIVKPLKSVEQIRQEASRQIKNIIFWRSA